VTDDQKPTRERLLESALGLFSQHGFDGVSIRDLAASAEVNVAAVNYHFQSKENLYREVLLHLMRDTRQTALAQIDEIIKRGGGTPDLAELIRAYAGSFFDKAMHVHDGDSHLSPLIREMHEFRSGAETLFAEVIIPVNQAFGRALALACPTLDQQRIKWIIASIIGQVIHLVMRWHRSHQVFVDNNELGQTLRTLFPPLGQSAAQYIAAAVDHITTFTLGGIKQFETEV